MRTNFRTTSCLIIVLASVGVACSGGDQTAGTTTVGDPVGTAVGADTTTSATAPSPTASPSSAADTLVAADTTVAADSGVTEGASSAAARLAPFDPPAELGAGYTRVEGEGAPPPAAAWQAMAAIGDCDGLEPMWNVASVDKLAARNIRYLGATAADLRGLVVFVLSSEGASVAWQWFAGAPSQVATCWQEGIRVLTGIADFTIVDAGPPANPAGSPSILWRYQTVGSATFAFQTTQAFGMVRRGDVIAWVSLAGATDEAEVTAIFADVDERLAEIAA